VVPSFKNKAKLSWFPFTCRQTAMIIRKVDDMMVRKGYSMRTLVLRFLTNESAATAIEYGLFAAGIVSLAIIAIAVRFGSDRNDIYTIALQ
jgi:Flp pilus assembly pilin Flp